MGKMQRSVYKFCGDPEWMAPEVLSQATTYNEKADIYSIGITAIEMLYGKTPFHQWPALKILLCKLYYQVPINPPPLAGGVPISIREGSKQFTEFVERCLHRDPSLR
jgi:serine/threonine protein kinase